MPFSPRHSSLARDSHSKEMAEAGSLQIEQSSQQASQASETTGYICGHSGQHRKPVLLCKTLQSYDTEAHSWSVCIPACRWSSLRPFVCILRLCPTGHQAGLCRASWGKSCNPCLHWECGRQTGLCLCQTLCQQNSQSLLGKSTHSHIHCPGDCSRKKCVQGPSLNISPMFPSCHAQPVSTGQCT